MESSDLSVLSQHGFHWMLPIHRAVLLEEIGKELSVTRERVRQIESSAIKKLKHPKVGKNLKNYVES